MIDSRLPRSTVPTLVGACFVAGALMTYASPGAGIGHSSVVAATGEIAGRVRFAGSAPDATPAPVAADPFCAAQHAEPLVIRTIEAESGNLRHVVVYLKGDLSGDTPVHEVVIRQSGCTYEPHVTTAQTGQPIVFRNGDETLHNINVQPDRNPAFNIAQPIPGMETRRSFSNPEVGIPIRCDVHPWMTAFLSVFDHPFHAVTAGDGRFVLPSVPDGTYVIEAWHEVLGRQTRQVSVRGATTQVEFTFE